MSDKPIATIVCGVLAFPVMIICCAIGPVAFVALLSATVSTGMVSVFGENYLSNMVFTGLVLALVVVGIRSWRNRRSTEKMLESKDP